MYNYHESAEHAKRLLAGTCRCASAGTVFKLRDCLGGGLVNDPTNADLLLTTSSLATSWANASGARLPSGHRYIYAVSESYELHFAPDGERQVPDSVKHETLFKNADVRAAGEIAVVEGVISEINDRSGSYRTYGALEADAGFADAVLVAIDKLDAPLSPSLREKLEQLRHSE
jgi:hypothetical protein